MHKASATLWGKGKEKLRDKPLSVYCSAASESLRSMTPQKRACIFILVIVIVSMLLVINQSHAVASAMNPNASVATGGNHTPPLMTFDIEDDDNAIVVSLYYESLCPYCAKFIVNQLVKVFETDLVSIVRLRLVPWGNTKITPNNTWICQVLPQF